MHEDDILYMKDHENSTRRLLEVSNSFNKMAGCKINLQKPAMSSLEKLYPQYAPNILKIKKIIELKEHILEITLAKEVEELYNENFKPLKKDIGEDT